MRLKPTNNHRHRVWFRGPIAWALGAIAASAILSGCGQTDVVELAKPAEANKAAAGQTAKKTPRARRTPPATGKVSQATDITESYTPPPTPSPTPIPEAITISASTDMKADNGAPDGEGGWVLTSNGSLMIDNVKVEFPVRAVTLELRGDPAHDIWPEFDLNAYNRTRKLNFFPWPNDYASSSSYHIVSRELEKPLPAGDYLLTFRYYNNSAIPEGSTEDRNIALKRIVLEP